MLQNPVQQDSDRGCWCCNRTNVDTILAESFEVNFGTKITLENNFCYFKNSNRNNILLVLGLLKKKKFNIKVSSSELNETCTNGGPYFAVTTCRHEKDTCYKPRLSHCRKALLLGKLGLTETWWIYSVCTLLMPLSSCQKSLAVFCLNLQQLWAWLLPHPKKDSICVLTSEPQTLGSSNISTVEHMRGTSDEITL